MFQFYSYEPSEALAIFLDSPLFVAFFCLALQTLINTITHFVKHSLQQSSDSEEKKRIENYNRLENWKEKKNLFNPQAINIRASWGKRIAQIPPKPRQPFKAGINFIETAIIGLTNPMLNMIVFWIAPKQVVLKLPFEVPHFLRPFFQMSLPYATSSSDVSFVSFYFILGYIKDVFVEWIPVIRKAPKTPATIGPLENTVNDFLIKESKWELDTAEDELSSFLDAEIKKRQ